MSRLGTTCRAAGLLAGFVARREIARSEALGALAAAAIAAAPDRDPSGLRVRVAHALDDATAEAMRERDRAPWRVRDALAPLLDRLADRAALLAAGLQAAGDVVTTIEARLLVEHAVRRHLAHRSHGRHSGGSQ